MKSLKNLLDTEANLVVAQFMKFSFVGVTSTIMDFALLIFLHEVFDMSPILAAAISYIVSLLYNYWGSMRWVFEHRDDMTRTKEATVFFILSGIGLVINEAFMTMGKIYCMFYGLDYHDGIYYLIAKLLADVGVSIWNFFSRKKWLDGTHTNVRAS